MSELFRQFAAESARIRPYPRGLRRCPPNVRRTFGGVRRKIFLADVRRIRAEPGGVRAYPRGFARIRGGSSSAEPVASFYSLRFTFVMGKYWLLSKWLLLFILTILVNPGLLKNDMPGPSNEECLNSRTRRTVAVCKNCNFKAYTEVRESIY